MGRDWTPQEMYMRDKYTKEEFGEALRDAEFEFINSKTGERTPLISPEHKKIGKMFPEISFLLDDFYRMYDKYSEYPVERNIMFAYIEATLQNIEKDNLVTMQTMATSLENIFAGRDVLLCGQTEEYMIRKALSISPIATEHIEKWYTGSLSPSFYYNNENNSCLCELIDFGMADIVKDRCKEFAHGSTHSTKFHADEVFTTAFMRKLNPDFTYERNLDIPEDKSVLVYDKGMGKYDHHQKDNEIRDNGIPYASFGKVYRDFSKYLIIDDRLMTKDERDVVENRLVQKIDAVDNGIGRNDYSSFIDLLNPINRDGKPEEKENEMFEKAVSFAQDVLERFMEKSVEIGRQFGIFKENIANDKNIKNGVLSLNEYVNINEPNVKDILIEKEIDLVVYPSMRGGYNVQQVQILQEDGTNVGRLPFPQEWCGKKPEELPEHITFCHAGNWLLSIDSKNKREAFDLTCKIADISREELKKDIGREADQIL